MFVIIHLSLYSDYCLLFLEKIVIVRSTMQSRQISEIDELVLAQQRMPKLRSGVNW